MVTRNSPFTGVAQESVRNTVVLLLAPVSSRPARESLKKLEHEYSFRGELEATWAVRPLALSKYKEQTGACT